MIEVRCEVSPPPIGDEARLVTVCNDLLARVRGAATAAHTDLNLIVVDDQRISALNERHTGRDQATDVLAFPDGEVDPDTGSVYLGDIVVSWEMACREAQARRVPATEELLLYAVHGLLHLLGWDDTTAEARAAMRTAERDTLARWGITPHWGSA